MSLRVGSIADTAAMPEPVSAIRAAEHRTLPAMRTMSRLACTVFAATTAAQPTVFDLRPGPDSSIPSHFVDLSGTCVFWADDSGRGSELWRSDGTTAGTYRISNITSTGGGALRQVLVSTGERAFFVATTTIQGDELWVTDGTVGGTRLVRDMLPNSESTSPEQITVVGPRVFFSGRTVGIGARELHVSDGTFAGTRIVKDIRPGSAGANPRNLTALGDRLYFFADDGVNGTALWVSDGSEAGTQMVAVPSGPGSTRALTALTAAGGRLWFGVSPQSWWEGNPEIWSSDGTAGGTRMVTQIPLAPFELMLYANSFYAIGTGCIVSMTSNGFAGVRSWLTDGTATGTVPLGVGFDRRAATVWQGALYFGGHESSSGSELWRTDGTLAGTRMVTELAPGTASAMPLQMLPRESRLLVLMQFNDGHRLIATDGTAAGTSTLHATTNAGLTAAGSRHGYFQGLRPTALWRSDGAATVSLGPTNRWNTVASAGDHIYFDGYDAALGQELHSYAVGASARSIGATCPNGVRTPRLTLTDPVLGGSTQAEVSELAPQALFVALLSAPTAPSAFGICRVYVSLPGAIALGPMASNGGAGQFTLPIPDDNALLGVALVTQAAATASTGIDLTNACLLRLGR